MPFLFLEIDQKKLISNCVNLFLLTIMTCYFRHLVGILAEAGITVSPANRKEVDKIVRNLVGSQYKDCPSIWREVKKLLVDDKGAFVARLKEAWATNKTELRDKCEG